MFFDSTETADHRTPDQILMEMEEHHDGDAPIVVDGVGSIPVAAMAIFVKFLLPDGRATNPHFWQTAARRLCALAHAMQVPGVREHSLTDLAVALSCSRSLLSLLAVEVRDLGNLDCRAGRNHLAREKYSKTASAVWGRRGRAQAAKAKQAADED